MQEIFMAEVLSLYHVSLSIVIISLIRIIVKLYLFFKHGGFTISYSEERILSKNTGEELEVNFYRNNQSIPESVYNEELEFEKIDNELADDEVVVNRKELEESFAKVHLEGQKYILEAYKESIDRTIKGMDNLDAVVQIDEKN